MTTKTSHQELNTFAFGGKSENKSTWNQPFPIQIPLFPTPPVANPVPTSFLGERRIPGKSFTHLPSFPPSRTYAKTSISEPAKDSNDISSVSSRKRKIESNTEESSSLSSAQLREKKITATKNIQKTLTRLDSLLHVPVNNLVASDDISAPQAPSSLLCGPPLNSVSSGYGNRGVVLDENCDLFKTMTKEERLLMGLSVSEKAGEKEDGSSSSHPHHDIGEE